MSTGSLLMCKHGQRWRGWGRDLSGTPSVVEAKASVYCRFFVAFLLTSCVSVVFCVNMLCLFGKREENKRNPYHRVLHLSVLVLFVMVGVAVYF